MMSSQLSMHSTATRAKQEAQLIPAHPAKMSTAAATPIPAVGPAAAIATAPVAAAHVATAPMHQGPQSFLAVRPKQRVELCATCTFPSLSTYHSCAFNTPRSNPSYEKFFG